MKTTRGLAAAILCLGAWATPAAAQDVEDEVLGVVHRLFDAMRGADSATVRELFHPDLVAVASSGERDGVPGVAFGQVDGFVEAVGGAEPGAFDERIGEAQVRFDDHLATVFTPYAFYYNGNLSHCGVNVFQIARVGEDWKIVGVVDTRRREGCEEWLQ